MSFEEEKHGVIVVKGGGHTTSSYHSRDVPSLRCCRQGWCARSGLQVGRGARDEAPKNSYCWASLILPDHCHNNCAERDPADLVPDWLWRRSLDDGGAVIGQTERDKVRSQFCGTN